MVPSSSVVGLGSAIFAFMAAGTFKTIEEAQEKICPSHKVFEPQPDEAKVYDELHPLYDKLYFAFGEVNNPAMGSILPKLIHIAESVNQETATPVV